LGCADSRFDYLFPSLFKFIVFGVVFSSSYSSSCQTPLYISFSLSLPREKKVFSDLIYVNEAFHTTVPCFDWKSF